jgi:hypothetical protein
MKENIKLLSKDTDIKNPETLKKAKELAKNSKQKIIVPTKDGDALEITPESTEEIDLTIDEIYEIIKPKNIIFKKKEINEKIKTLLESKPNKSVIDSIDSNQNVYSNIFDNENTKNKLKNKYEELFRKFSEKTGISDFNIYDLNRVLSGNLKKIYEYESRNQIDLEELAVDIIKNEYDITDDDVDFDVELISNPIEINIDLKSSDIKKPDNYSDDELNSEIEKRKIMNAIIHGNARKIENMFHLLDDDKIPSSLKKVYDETMLSNNLMYWMMDDNSILANSKYKFGYFELDLSGEKPKIIAKAMIFPVLLHELGKAVMELITVDGLPEDEDVYNYVVSKTDNLENETWNLRTGEVILNRILDELDIDDLEYRNNIFHKISSLPANDFVEFIKGLMNDDEKAKKLFKNISNTEKERIKKEKADDAISDVNYFKNDDYGDDIDDIDLDDINIDDLLQ